MKQSLRKRRHVHRILVVPNGQESSLLAAKDYGYLYFLVSAASSCSPPGHSCSGFRARLKFPIRSVPSSSVFGVSLRNTQIQSCSNAHLAAPLLDTVQYEVRDFTSTLPPDHDQYNGAPTPELEAAWNHLQDSTSLPRFLSPILLAEIASQCPPF